MVHHGDRTHIREVIAVPEDVPVGVVVGRSGSQIKKLAADHGVRCRADFDAREVFLHGSCDSVSSATRAILELFKEHRAKHHGHRAKHERKGRAEHKLKKIHKSAVCVSSGKTEWAFHERDPASIAADESTEAFRFRLVKLSDGHTDAAELDKPSNGWLSVFNESFRQQMLEDVATLAAQNPSRINVKLAFGLQCFALPGPPVGRGPIYSWEELQALRLYSHMRPRWSNNLNTASAVLTDLLNVLETECAESTTYATELVVYVSEPESKKEHGFSIKYHLENGNWHVVDRKPVSIVHAIYNIALDNDTAFRVRAFTREEAPQSLAYTEFIHALEITTLSEEDPYTTTVTTTSGFPRGFAIQSVAVCKTATIDWRGLRFKISYKDAERQNVTLACRLPQEEDEKVTPMEAMEKVLNGVLSLITTTT